MTLHAISPGLDPGGELDYVETASTLTVTATTAATAQALVTASAIVFNGSTPVVIQVYAQFSSISPGEHLVGNLYDGSTDLGRITQVFDPDATNAQMIPLMGARRLIPNAGSHTYSWRFWKTGGTASVTAGAGGTDTALPAFIRVTRA